ncbi:MAG: hypothetical protein J2P37_04830 [Ktedonobacteraceae bacterium]|nr:hypothetical protein [Ktedonobacteraceae bacterium]
MLTRISVMVLRVCALLALILGILFWIGVVPVTEAWQGIHMLLGILVVICLWVLAFTIGFARNGGNLGLAIGAFLLGLIVLIYGVSQQNLFAMAPSLIWLLKTIHLLLGLGAVGMGEAIAGRQRRLAQTTSQ